jgi:hypothetical protein
MEELLNRKPTPGARIVSRFSSLVPVQIPFVRRDPARTLGCKRPLVPGESFRDDFSVRVRQLLRPEIARDSEIEGQLVDRACEAERHLIVVVHRRAGIDLNVEGLVLLHE